MQVHAGSSPVTCTTNKSDHPTGWSFLFFVWMTGCKSASKKAQPFSHRSKAKMVFITALCSPLAVSGQVSSPCYSHSPNRVSFLFYNADHQWGLDPKVLKSTMKLQKKRREIIVKICFRSPLRELYKDRTQFFCFFCNLIFYTDRNLQIFRSGYKTAFF